MIPTGLLPGSRAPTRVTASMKSIKQASLGYLRISSGGVCGIGDPKCRRIRLFPLQRKYIFDRSSALHARRYNRANLRPTHSSCTRGTSPILGGTRSPHKERKEKKACTSCIPIGHEIFYTPAERRDSCNAVP